MLQNSYQDSLYDGKAFLSGHCFPGRGTELRGVEGLKITVRRGMCRSRSRVLHAALIHTAVSGRRMTSAHHIIRNDSVRAMPSF
jgi:hypothetical protein